MICKKNLFIGFIGIALILISTMFIYIVCQVSNRLHGFIKLPDVQLFELDGGAPHSTPKERDKILVFFKSECPFCEQTVNEIINPGNKLENVEVLLISSGHPDSIQLFSLNHHSEKVTYLCDETALFGKGLKVKNYPTIFIYSGSKEKLTRRFIGSVPLTLIIKALKRE